MDRNDDKIDADILKGRQDIRRAREDAAGPNPPSSQERTNNQPQPAPAEPSPMTKAVIDANKQGRAKSDRSDIPHFNVADTILARQRLAAAAKRTAPAKERSEQTPRQIPARLRTDQIEHKEPAYHKIIAQIVARDIDTLCRDRSLAG